MPAEVGIQEFQILTKHWIPVFTGMTTFYEPINITQFHAWRQSKHQYKNSAAMSSVCEEKRAMLHRPFEKTVSAVRQPCNE